MKLIVTIDAEEDNWGDYGAENISVSNLKKIPELQDLFDEFDVRPTYLVSFPVASNWKASTFLDGIQRGGRCEIGAHCHPWNTPPISEKVSKESSMMCNLPQSLQYQKVGALTEEIASNTGTAPSAFRVGRWALDANLAEILIELGYKVDTSVTPYVDWTKENGPDFSELPFKSHWNRLIEVFPSEIDVPFCEIPPSIGFLQSNFEMANAIYKSLVNTRLRSLRLYGALYRMGLLNRVWMSPEFQTVGEMTRLAAVLIGRNELFLNMTFHSTSLQAGLTPFVRSKEDEKIIFQRIRKVLTFVKEMGIQSATLTEAANSLE